MKTPLIPNKPLIESFQRLRAAIGTYPPKLRRERGATRRGVPSSLRRALRGKYFFFLTKDQAERASA